MQYDKQFKVSSMVMVFARNAAVENSNENPFVYEGIDFIVHFDKHSETNPAQST